MTARKLSSKQWRFLESDLTQPPTFPNWREATSAEVVPGRTRDYKQTLGVLEPLAGPLKQELLRIDGNEDIGVPVFWSYNPDQMRHSQPSEHWNYGGKGLSEEAARVSVLAEMVERFCAKRLQNPELLRATIRDISDQCPNLDQFGLSAAPPSQAELHEWGYAHALFSDSMHLLPASLLLHPYQPFVGRKLCNATFNGVASGNNFHEALLHGLYELIERDAWMLFQLRRPTLFPIDLAAVDNSVIAETLAWFDRRGTVLLVLDISTDRPGYVFAGWLFDAGFEGAPILPLVSGARTNPQHAIERLITEICQARANILFTKETRIRPTSKSENLRLCADFLARAGMKLGDTRDLDSFPLLCAPGISSELEYLMTVLHDQGVEIFVSSLGRDANRFEVLRINAVGLQPLSSHANMFGNEDLGFSERRTKRGCT